MLKDVQNHKDDRNISIDKVGIKNISYPITLKDKSKGVQSTVAKVSLSASLSHEFKGTHMSRFVAVLNNHKDDISLATARNLLDDIRNTLQSDEAHCEFTFPYFMEKAAPVSGLAGLMDYECTLQGTANADGHQFTLTVRVPIQSLCPCSKEISKYGAHNQRSIATISVTYDKKLIWIEDLIAIAESSGSASIYSLLKREDEKFVTEQAYENPAFVEDIVRTITEKLKQDERVISFEVTCVNMESIHNHDAWATISYSKK